MERKTVKTKLCLICCKSFNFNENAGSNFEESELLQKLRKQLKLETLTNDDNQLSYLAEELNGSLLSVCINCKEMIRKVGKCQEVMEEVEEQVRSLQIKILGRLKKLKMHTVSFQEGIGDIVQVILDSDHSSMFLQIDKPSGQKGDGNWIRRNVVTFREQILKAAEELNLYCKKIDQITLRDVAASIKTEVNEELFQSAVPSPPNSPSNEFSGLSTSSDNEDDGLGGDDDYLVPKCELKVDEEAILIEQSSPTLNLRSSKSKRPKEQRPKMPTDSKGTFPPKKKKPKKKISSKSKSVAAETVGVNLTEMGSFKKQIVRRLLKRARKIPLESAQESGKRPHLQYNPPPLDSLTLGPIQILIDEDTKSLHCSICQYTPERMNYSQNKSPRSLMMERLLTKHIFSRHMSLIGCPHCAKTFQSDLLYKKHLKTHGELEKMLSCDICGKPAISKDSLNLHKWSHFNESEKEAAIKSGKKDPRLRFKYFRDKQAGLQFQCAQCGKHFQTEGNLKQHEVIHRQERDQVICPTCGKTMLRHSYESYHQRYACPGKEMKRLKCPHCDVTFKAEVFMKRHIQSKHRSSGGGEEGDERPIKCEDCGKGFRTMHCLRTHREIHKKERDFVCENEGCRKDFNRKKNWKRHKATCKFRIGR